MESLAKSLCCGGVLALYSTKIQKQRRLLFAGLKGLRWAVSKSMSR
jgi:hypothetical protein